MFHVKHEPEKEDVFYRRARRHRIANTRGRQEGSASWSESSGQIALMARNLHGTVIAPNLGHQIRPGIIKTPTQVARPNRAHGAICST